MPETVPRLLVIITGIVAVLAVFVGVRDYIERKDNAAALQKSTSSVSAVQAPPATARKKPASAKARRNRASVPDANLSREDLAANATKDLLVNAGSANAEIISDAPQSKRSEPPQDDLKAALSLASCVPLPNSTRTGDVDANYYQGWAREYGCKVE